MNEDFIPFELAKKLREKGFDDLCAAYYLPNSSQLFFNTTLLRGSTIEDCLFSNNTRPIGYICSTFIDAPTISQVLKWFRDKKKIHIEIFLYDGKYSYLIKSITQICEDDLFHKCLNEDTIDEEYVTYEAAALKGIEYTINNLI